MAYKHLTLILFILFINKPITNDAQTRGKNEQYLFNNIYSSWNALKLAKIKVSVDKKVLWNSQYSSKITVSGKYIDATKKVLFIFSKYIPVENDSKSKCISFHCKSDFACNIYIKTYCLNKDEEIVDRDSAVVASTKAWQKASVNLPTHDKSGEVYVEISCESDSNRLSEVDCHLWLDKLTVITTKEIEASKSIRSPSGNCIENSVPLTFENDSCIDKITPLHDHKIIALAETVHGSKTITRSACQIIRRLVEKENCKLIMLELPFDWSLTFNSYIHGDNNIPVDSLINRLPMLLSNSDITSLMKWLRNYNHTAEKKVSILGFDFSWTNFEATGRIADFLGNYHPPISCAGNVQDSLILNWNNSKNKYKYIDKNQCFKKNMTEADYNNLKFSLQTDIVREQLCMLQGYEKYSEIQFRLKRDSLMYFFVKYATDHYLANEEKAVLYGHFTHLNKYNAKHHTFLLKPLGNYLANQWKDNYYVLALTVGEGEITSSNNNDVKPHYRLDAPSINSIEDLCGHAQSDYLFSDLKGMDDFLPIRQIHNTIYSGKQFININVRRRIDGLIYIRKSESFDPPAEILKLNDLNYYIKKTLKVLSRR